jgi:tetratricopeptide (TPR) repeat protein
LLLESLKAEAVPTALAHFQRAIELDPGFAPAYVGLANARCQLFERARFSPDRPAGMLSQALEDVKRAVELDAGYAEAHATMAFILTSAGHREEARRAARTAVAIEPNHWMHHFRLGYATWGSERLVSLERALSLYADFPFAHFQIAMVHVARGALALAASALRDGLAAQGRLTGSSRRFPAHGLHWLVGVIALARGDGEGALDAFDAERAGGGSEVYGSEFALAACWGCGYALLKLNRREDASREFEACLTADLSGRAALGFATAQSGNGRSVQKALGAVASLVAGMRAAGRESEARLLEAGEHAVRSQKQQALTSIEQALGAAPPGPFGWLLPIDPVFSSLRDLPKFRTAVQAVAARAA